jgi:hypothetical protein
MNRLMGHNITRKDGAEHLAERKVFLKAVSPQAVKEVWIERFRTHAQRILCHRGASGVLSLAAGRMRQAPRDAAVQVWDMDQRECREVYVNRGRSRHGGTSPSSASVASRSLHTASRP